jgi:hypothetical protein
VRRLRPELWLQKNWLLHHDNSPSHTSFYSIEFLTKNNKTVVSQTPCFPLFPRLKIKLKVRHFDTVFVIEADSQAVLHALTEHDFQDAFKKCQKRWKLCIRTERDHFNGDGDK